MAGCYDWIHQQNNDSLNNVIDPQALSMPRSTASDNGRLTSNLVTTKDKMCLICTIAGETWTVSKECFLCSLTMKYKRFFVLRTHASPEP